VVGVGIRPPHFPPGSSADPFARLVLATLHALNAAASPRMQSYLERCQAR